jgi:hypothetical protein
MAIFIGTISAQIYIDIGVGLGYGVTRENGVRLSLFDCSTGRTVGQEVAVEVNVVRFGVDLSGGNRNLYLTGEISAIGHRFQYNENFIQINQYLIGPGVLYYPIPRLQFSTAIGLSLQNMVTNLPGETPPGASGFAFTGSAAFDFGEMNRHGVIAGVKFTHSRKSYRWFNQDVDLNMTWIGIFARYRLRS